MFPDFIQLAQKSALIWIDRSLADPVFVDRVANADRLLGDPSCQIIKDQKKITVGRVSLEIAGAPRSIYIKRYNVFSLRYTLASPFMPSGALRALQGAAILHTAGIATAAPIAAVEIRRWGALVKSFFISQEIAGGKTVDARWHEDLQRLSGRDGFAQRRAFLVGLAQLFHALHGRQIYHNDLKDANILAVGNSPEQSLSFLLLDLEGVKRYSRLSDRRRVKNLVQLNRTLGQYLRRADKLVFLKSYLGASFADRKLKRRLIKNVARESRRVNFLKAGRRTAHVVAKQANHG